MVAQGGLDATEQDAGIIRRWIGNPFGREQPPHDLARGQGFLGSLEDFEDRPEYGAPLEVPVRFAPANRDASGAELRIEHLQHGLDVPHAVGKPFGIPLVVDNLAAQLGMELKQCEGGLFCGDLCVWHPLNLGDRGIHF